MNELESKKDYLKKLKEDKMKLSCYEQQIYNCDKRIRQTENEILSLEK